MSYWVYKCNNRRHPAQVAFGDWRDFFAQHGNSEWGSTEWVPTLAQLSPGDTVIAYQTDRNELVGVTKVEGLRKRRKHLDLYLQSVEEIRTKVRPLKKADPKIAAIPALQPGPIKTVYPISASDAKLLLTAARKSAKAKK